MAFPNKNALSYFIFYSHRSVRVNNKAITFITHCHKRLFYFWYLKICIQIFNILFQYFKLNNINLILFKYFLLINIICILFTKVSIVVSVLQFLNNFRDKKKTFVRSKSIWNVIKPKKWINIRNILIQPFYNPVISILRFFLYSKQIVI